MNDTQHNTIKIGAKVRVGTRTGYVRAIHHRVGLVSVRFEKRIPNWPMTVEVPAANVQEVL
jgi:hypothetical protein